MPPSRFREREELHARRARQRAERRRERKGRIVLIAAAVGVIGAGIGVDRLSGRGDSGGPRQATSFAEWAQNAPPEVELPRGGRLLFPANRIVAFDGVPGNPDLGPLGRSGPVEASRRLLRQARGYDKGPRRILPALHLIAVVAQADPGTDGRYRARIPMPVLRRYLRTAREQRMLLLLDVQPGHSSFIDEVERLEPLLREPEVGIALDPEWNLEEGELPGAVLGSVDAREVNEVATFMQRIAAEEDLPQKLLLVHQFDASMISGRGEIRELPRVAIAFSIDGFGSPEEKRGVYRRLAPRSQRSGFKLFYEEDYPLMSPRAVLSLRPQPEVIVYE